MKQCRAEFFYGIRRPLSGFAILVAMTMLAQHPVRQCAVPQQLDRAVEVPFQPFGVDACGRVIVQCFVHAGDVLYLLQHRPDVMADEDDGAVAVDLRQQLVEAGFEALVDVGARLVENKQLRVADDGSSQQGALQLSAAQLSDGPVFKSLESHAVDHLSGFLAVTVIETAGQRLLGAESREDYLENRDGEGAVDRVVLREIARREWFVIFDDFSSCGAKQSQNAFDKSCLASAVGPDDTEEIVLVDLQIDIVEHRASVIGGGESSDGEEGGGSRCFRMLVGFSFFIHELLEVGY